MSASGAEGMRTLFRPPDPSGEGNTAFGYHPVRGTRACLGFGRTGKQWGAVDGGRRPGAVSAGAAPAPGEPTGYPPFPFLFPDGTSAGSGPP
mmetsp:Transcript_20320/g.48406  ORF Transcript_20320/g.48406 Transcript_20320/m.48406 type:complete len:92 (-) Transcript_20320:57-332(-)